MIIREQCGHHRSVFHADGRLHPPFSFFLPSFLSFFLSFFLFGILDAGILGGIL